MSGANSKEWKEFLDSYRRQPITKKEHTKKSENETYMEPINTQQNLKKSEIFIQINPEQNFINNNTKIIKSHSTEDEEKIHISVKKLSGNFENTDQKVHNSEKSTVNNITSNFEVTKKSTNRHVQKRVVNNFLTNIKEKQKSEIQDQNDKRNNKSPRKLSLKNSFTFITTEDEENNDEKEIKHSSISVNELTSTFEVNKKPHNKMTKENSYEFIKREERDGDNDEKQKESVTKLTSNFEMNKNKDVEKKYDNNFLTNTIKKNETKKEKHNVIQLTQNINSSVQPKENFSVLNGDKGEAELNNKDNPVVRTIANAALRDWYNSYHNQANVIVDSLPRHAVKKTNGLQDIIDNIASQGGLEKLSGRSIPENEKTNL